ncbi:Uncharacterised protein [Citrobacter koseri]|nr:Uncharacterised protein [Citrobacter koseri]
MPMALRDGDNADHHHQFDKRKSALFVHCLLLELTGATLANAGYDPRAAKIETGKGIQKIVSGLHSKAAGLRGRPKKCAGMAA